MGRTKSYKKHLIECLKDSKEASAYLNASLEEGDSKAFLIALKDVADAHGGLTKLAEKTSLNRESLYKSLSKKGNPKLENLQSILSTCGLEIRICPTSNS